MSETLPASLALTDADAVTTNAAGALTGAQHEALAGQMRRIRGLLVFFLVSAVLLILIALPVWLGQEMSDSPLAQVIRITLLAVIALVLFVTLWTVTRTRRMQTDLSEPRIAHGDGSVVWSGTAYVADIAGRNLLALRDTTMPPPGAYRFYYLRDSGWLLSAQPLEGERQLTEADLTARLAEANALLASALPANREERLGVGQARWLLRPLLSAALLVVFVVAVAVVVGSLAASVGPAWLVVLVALSAVLIIFGDLTRIVNTLRDISRGRVLAVEGSVERVITGSRSRPSYYYAVDDTQFRVTEAGYNVLDERGRYRLYYVPHTQRLVNIEQL